MRKLRVLLAGFVAFATFSLGANAATILTENVAGVNWTYYNKDGYVNVGGGAQSTAVDSSQSGALVVPDALGGTIVKFIGTYAFSDCQLITSVTLPEGVAEIGKQAFANCIGLEDVHFPSKLAKIGDDAFYHCIKLKVVDLPQTVVSVASGAFYDCDALTEVKLSSNMSSIEDNTFSDCSKLIKVMIPSKITSIGSKAFCNCTSLPSIKIPKSIAKIGYWAFHGCKLLKKIYVEDGDAQRVKKLISDSSFDVTSLTFEVDDGSGDLPDETPKPDGVYSDKVNGVLWTYEVRNGDAYVGGGTSEKPAVRSTVTGVLSIPDRIGNSDVKGVNKYAFYNCVSLTEVIIPSTVTQIEKSAFQTSGIVTVRIPSSVEKVGDWAFYKCRALREATVDSSVMSMGVSVFQECISLKTVALPAALEKLSATFNGCANLEEIEIPTSVKSLENGAFKDCAKLRSVFLSKNIVRVDDDVFDGCASLASMTVDIGNTQFSSYGGLLYDKSRASLVRCPPGVDSVSLCSELESICDYAFDGCSKICEVHLPQGVRKVGNFTFRGCLSLKLVSWPDDVCEVGEGAFEDCESIETIRIPESLEELSANMFKGCKSLLSLLLTEKIWVIGSGVFYGCERLNNIVIPSGVVSIGAQTFADCKELLEIWFEGEPPVGLTNSEIEKSAQLYYNILYADRWASIVCPCKAMDPYVPRSVRINPVIVSPTEGTSMDAIANTYTALTIKLLASAEDIEGEDGFLVQYREAMQGSWQVATGNFFLCEDGILRDEHGEKPMIQSYREGEFEYNLKVVANHSDKSSSVVSFNLKVYPAKRASFVMDRVSCLEGSEISLKEVQLSGASSKRLYVYLMAEDYSKVKGRVIAKPGNQSPICIEAGAQIWKGDEKIQMLNGPSLLTFTVVLCETEFFDETKIVGGYVSSSTIVRVDEVEPNIVSSHEDLVRIFGSQNDAVKNIKAETELAAFNAFLRDCSICSADELTTGQKQYAYRSFKLSEITTAPQLFDAEPVLKFDNLELTGGNLSLTISLSAGAEAIQLAKDKLAEKIRVGSTLGGITSKPTIVMSPEDDGTTLTFIIAPPKGNQGFVKVQIDK